ncbi:SMU1112c/YaeR family gloxylase I-like metalloprotein [Gracilibacillus kekensis]|uniref:Glyoxylase I family protein n=1 Tax=Gracilibacillus kekensis TaxID=1027249 RepID=A0A1M7JLY2_9BACI|nr:VOC family protein [Gracilibacillus kekensis]SHM53517.1 glyoxylase I family protein [Gracilibacillus kekensis]
MFLGVHHIAIICSDYQEAKDFYLNKLGFTFVQETYRKERDSYKLDLALNNEYVIELFSFPVSPPRPNFPEAQGLRHLAFTVEDIDETIKELALKGIETEGVRIDPTTKKRFTFFQDPDQLPIEIYEKG